MQHREIIENITEELLLDDINYQSLRDKLQEFMKFLIELTQLEFHEPIKDADIQFENGIALNTRDAAMCVVDIIRTRQFIRGILKAVQHVQQQKSTTIKIMYAGTGPFAMLILPLLTKYTSDQLQLTLLEVNKDTIACLKRLIKKLEIEEYVAEIIQEDASKHKTNKKEEIDIFISETMQFGLVKEQQVPIALNLVSQLRKDVIMIPQNIKLDLTLMNADTELIINNKFESRFKVLKTVLEFDTEFIHTNAEKIKRSNRIELCEGLQFIEETNNTFDRLAMLTSIQVYRDEWIHIDLSSLTIPKRILNIADVKPTVNSISMDYVIKEIPDFEYKLT
ncbi:SAM-dependent methyltransferase [Kordia jejudonensis]|uniref:hypothetical protein n=1 Tax=Kordia jejudonensis TaxID=1348245 RepID=UPI0006297DD0|nr:hypothetical protein [Kordia jejudonensis]